MRAIVLDIAQVAELRQQGFDDTALRRQLKADGYSSSAVSRLLPCGSARGRKRNVADVEADRVT